MNVEVVNHGKRKRQTQRQARRTQASELVLVPAGAALLLGRSQDLRACRRRPRGHHRRRRRDRAVLRDRSARDDRERLSLAQQRHRRRPHDAGQGQHLLPPRGDRRGPAGQEVPRRPDEAGDRQRQRLPRGLHHSRRHGKGRRDHARRRQQPADGQQPPRPRRDARQQLRAGEQRHDRGARRHRRLCEHDATTRTSAGTRACTTTSRRS